MPQWNVVRLELARTPEFPGGSASRAFMLRVPLNKEGLIDEASLARRPAMATVRRFWPNEPDQTGYVVRKGRAGRFPIHRARTTTRSCSISKPSRCASAIT
jgi:hypothetical protein